MRKAMLKLSDVPSWPELIKAWRRIKRNEELRNVVLWGLLQFTGIRLGEALSLRVSDIDFTRGIIRIRQEKKRKEFLREVIVPEELLLILRKYIRKSVLESIISERLSSTNGRSVEYP